MSKHILFIGHEASRSGAPIALLQFMQWFREHAEDCTFSCILKRGGDLVPAFEAICPTLLMDRCLWHSNAVGNRLLRSMGLAKWANWLLRLEVTLLHNRQIDLIYCNSLDSYAALAVTVDGTIPVLCHVHELQHVIRTHIGISTAQAVLQLSDCVIACAQAVADNLIAQHGVEMARINVIHEYIRTESTEVLNVDARRSLRNTLGIGLEAFVVAGCGVPSWRKGSDLFVQLAKITRGLRPDLNIHFAWLGGLKDSDSNQQFLHDVDLAGVSDTVTMLPQLSDPIPYYQGCDTFVLTSREDPFPLVCLEAAACGLPIICFDRAGGIKEFVEGDCGRVVPYLDLQTMALEVIELLINLPLKKQIGNTASEKVRARHDVKQAAPKIMALIRKTLERSTR